MIFVLFANISCMILVQIGGSAWAGQQPFTPDYHTTDQTALQQNVTGYTAEQTSSNFLFRIFDFITLGWLSRISDVGYGLIFGFVQIFENMGIFSGDAAWLSPMMRAMLMFVYLFGMIELFTGRPTPS